MNFFQRLENLKKARCENWKELRKAIGVSKTLLHYWKKGDRDPTPVFLRKITEMEKELGISNPPPPVFYPETKSETLKLKDEEMRDLFSDEELLAFIKLTKRLKELEPEIERFAAIAPKIEAKLRDWKAKNR